jgi:hypothetical protein
MNRVNVRDGGYVPRARAAKPIVVAQTASVTRRRAKRGVWLVLRTVATVAIGLALILLIAAGTARIGDRTAGPSVSIGLRAAALVPGSPTLATVSVELRNDGDSPRVGSIEASGGQAGPSRPVTIPARSRVNVEMTVAASCGDPITVTFAAGGAEPLQLDTTPSCADSSSPP